MGWRRVGKGVAMGKDAMVVAVMAVLSLASCVGDDYTYSNFHCNLYIDNSTHQDATLASAMNPMSPGVFCKISYDAPTRSYAFSNNQGDGTKSTFDAKDTQRGNSGRIGMNNGLIVGYGNQSVDDADNNAFYTLYTFYAYDAQCPNCFDYTSIPLRNYPVSMTSAGMAVCANCKRQYNMNSGGYCSNNTGKGLTQYRASTTGALGTLFVN